MNSDPHESAAWRTFGMLDADEAAGFDEAMRHDPELKTAYREMECLTAAVAAATTAPVTPQSGQLERLHLRLGLNASKQTNWPAISGWAAAAALTLILVWNRNPANPGVTARNTSVPPAIFPQKESPVTQPEKIETTEEDQSVAKNAVSGTSGDHDVAAANQDGAVKTIVKVETKRLIQEIEVLREKLENFQERDRQRFEPVSGMAWPIVMRMTPPVGINRSADGLSLETDEPAITALLGDALTAANSPETPADAAAEPSAIPIYDAARDNGTLVLNNVDPPAEDERMDLWVNTKGGEKPIYVGRLPRTNTKGSESFDFSLGSTATIPSGFTLTRNKQGHVMPPTRDNTVLQGPR